MKPKKPVKKPRGKQLGSAKRLRLPPIPVPSQGPDVPPHVTEFFSKADAAEKKLFLDGSWKGLTLEEGLERGRAVVAQMHEDASRLKVSHCRPEPMLISPLASPADLVALEMEGVVAKMTDDQILAELKSCEHKPVEIPGLSENIAAAKKLCGQIDALVKEEIVSQRTALNAKQSLAQQVLGKLKSSLPSKPVLPPRGQKIQGSLTAFTDQPTLRSHTHP